MTPGWRFGVPLLGALAACSVNARELSPSELAVNQCEDDSVCYGGHCVDGTCHGSDGELTSLLLSVTPGTVPGIPSVTYYDEFPSLDEDGGALNIEVSPAIDIKGTVSIDPVRDCYPYFSLGGGASTPASPDANLIPVDVTFTPSERLLGIPAATYHAERRSSSVFEFFADVAPGQYDVYIQPYAAAKNPLEAELCEIPPRLLLNQSVQSKYSVALAPSSKLRVTVNWPRPADVPVDMLGGRMLEGWVVDLIEPVSGRLLSTRVTLSQPLDPTKSTSWTYDATLSYSPVLAPDADGVGLEPTGVGSELIRLTPPVGVTVPVILAEVAGARLSEQPVDATAAIELDARLPEPVEVEFLTAIAGVPTPVSAGVSFTAKELDGVTGVSTAFSRTVQVGTDGIERVSLLPGRYRVQALPKTGCTGDSCLGTTVIQDWVVPATPSQQGGKLIEFDVASRLEGSAFVANGGPAVGASVRAIASTFILDTDILDGGDGRDELLPRATSGIVASDGNFSFDADAGIFDFRVEPDPSTGFGWLVQPRVEFPLMDDPLSSLTVPLPIVYQGLVTRDDGVLAIPGALIRAYAYVKQDGTYSSTAVDGDVAVQVAETHADVDGKFTLLIPRVLGTER